MGARIDQAIPVKTTDICDEFPDQVMIAEPILRHYGKRKRFHGPAVTVKVHEDNVLVRSAVESAGDGRVLVVDGGGSLHRALLGDILAGLAAENGWAGVIVNGCIRDSTDMADIDLGVLALATVPLKSNKRGDGETGVSVSFAGLTIRPGEYLYADEDGLLLSHSELVLGT
ncbi:MAG: ribonuclease E activity regulator RraA [Gammaproteobacteria bacterium]